MLRSGKEHLESLRDGRVVYIGNEKVDDVTTHPAFRNAAQTVVALYDMKADPAYRSEFYLWPVRPLAGSRRFLHHRHGDELECAARA